MSACYDADYNNVNEQREDLQDKIRYYQEEIGYYQKEIRYYQEEIENYQEEIENYHDDIADLEEEIDDIEYDILNFNNEIDTLLDQLDELDETKKVPPTVVSGVVQVGQFAAVNTSNDYEVVLAVGCRDDNIDTFPPECRDHLIKNWSGVIHGVLAETGPASAPLTRAEVEKLVDTLLDWLNKD